MDNLPPVIVTQAQERDGEQSEVGDEGLSLSFEQAHALSHHTADLYFKDVSAGTRASAGGNRGEGGGEDRELPFPLLPPITLTMGVPYTLSVSHFFEDPEGEKLAFR